ncbi:MAG: hypothetical protein F2519_00730 [Actinobacteria bacterium]|uniref:Unannotated protein n=1 Tax=freshwater metagenome TaxID=449393 RepID=A0A6J7PLU4_9ZZZZ|nr:hypothetical protein [Actinomycetota bacterium]MTA04089.1 hypothetical protein [Actinomycetota bacterium]
MRKIEFRNNGSKDSLTGAPTTLIFLESLEREIALRSRLKEPLSIIMVSIPRTRDDYEIFLLNQAIRLVLRKEDFYCRASEDGFWLALRTDEHGANRAIPRFEASFVNTFSQDLSKSRAQERSTRQPPKIKIECIEFKPGTPAHLWIKKIDEKFFSH